MKNNYFNNALSNFIFDFSCGDAIRHLADRGYSSVQIMARLDYPLPFEKVQEVVTEYYLEKGILLREEPSKGHIPEQFEYVLDHDKFGKPSFRKVQIESETSEPVGNWTEQNMTYAETVELLARYDIGKRDKTSTTVTNSYVSCDYGRYPAESEIYEILNERQREYLQGIKWTSKRMYHLLDTRMNEIVIKLCEREIYDGRIYLGSERKIIIVE